MSIQNVTQNTLIADHVVIADTPWTRLVGLLNRAEIHKGEALVITDCRAIHMFFMKFGIDVIFVDRQYRVVGLVQRIQPFGHSPYFLKAWAAIELPEGVIAASKTKVTDQLLRIA